MAIREDLVASAASFLQDPSVAASPIENRVGFLQAKNLTQEEISAALARAGGEPGAPPAASYTVPPQAASPAAQQPPPFYGRYPPQYSQPYPWQPTPEAPRRDWRDWFIMATVVGGVGYGIYSLGKRYVYPLVAPPTPERLSQDKQSIDEQFEKTFALVEQLSKDTEALKTAEQARTERLDAALLELESVISDLKSANRRREDDAQRVRDDVQNLKDSLPRALDAQKALTDSRLLDVNTELKSLKTLISQRMNPAAASAGAGNYLRLSSGNAVPTAASGSGSGASSTGGVENAGLNGTGSAATEEKKPDFGINGAGASQPSPFRSGLSSGKASIPAWQLAAGKSSPAVNGIEAGSSSKAEASGSP